MALTPAQRQRQYREDLKIQAKDRGECLGCGQVYIKLSRFNMYCPHCKESWPDRHIYGVRR